MSIYIDDARRELTCSVGDLVLQEERFRIGFSAHEGYERLWVGQSVHSAYGEGMRDSHPEYRTEVTVRGEFQVEGYRCIVQGRIDGLVRSAEGLRVEEVKSLHFGRDLADFYDSAAYGRYKFQMEIYAYLVALQEDRPAEARLVLIDIASREEKIVAVPVDPAALRGRIEGRLGRILRAHFKERKALEKKAAAAERMPFPHEGARPFQADMMREVEDALRNRTPLLVTAPTGVGKTVAALYPALRYCLANGLRLFFLTAKTLQQEMAVGVLKRLNTEGAFRSIQLRAKSKICAHTEQLCHENFCPYARDYAEKMESTGVLDKLLYAFPHIEPDAVFSAGRAAVVCPFEVSLELVRHCDAVVCDYNYIFDPAVALKDAKEPGALADAVLIIDEAHNLVDRGRGYYSPLLSLAKVRAARAALDAVPTASGGRMASALDRLAAALDWIGGEHPGEAELVIEPDPAPLREPMAALESEIVDYFTYLREKELLRPNDVLLELYFEYYRFVKVLGLGGDEFTTLLRRTSDDLQVKVLCADASHFLGEAIRSAHGVIAMSATLDPPWFYRNVLGFPKEAVDASFPSPFPRENRKILVYPHLDTTYRKRMQQVPELAALLHRMGNAAPGNFLALFPSYQFLNAALKHYPRGGKAVIVQEPGHSMKETAALLERLKGARKSHFLFGVSGGMFAEGVDYPGEALRGVFIVSPALPQVSLEQSLLKDYYDRTHDDGFSYAYLVPGMTRVVQSAGRVIRSETDRGVIVLICRRFAERQYAQFFPKDWYDTGVSELVTDDPAGEIKAFFGGRH
jgi:DNA excision repair protein ERCC-2